MQQIRMTILSELTTSFTLATLLLNVIVHVAFAVAVAADAKKLEQQGSRPRLVATPLWVIATLATGLAGAAFYYFLHHSNLFARINKEPQT